MLDIVIDKSKCTWCGLCVDACPVACLKFDEVETVVTVNDLENCLVCRNCEDHCAPKCLTILFPEWPFRSSIAPEHIVRELPSVSDLYKLGHVRIEK